MRNISVARLAIRDTVFTCPTPFLLATPWKCVDHLRLEGENIVSSDLLRLVETIMCDARVVRC